MIQRYRTLTLAVAVVGEETDVGNIASTASLKRTILDVAFATACTGTFRVYKDTDVIAELHTGAMSDDKNPLPLLVPLDVGQKLSVTFNSSAGVTAAYCRLHYSEEGT